MPNCIAIVGGGPSGTACALTLEAAKRHNLFDKESKVIVFDSGKSDLQSAALWEVPGLPTGSPGPTVLADMHRQLQQTSAELYSDTVVSILRIETGFEISLASGKMQCADIIVLAGGYKQFDLQGNLELPTKKHPYSPKNRTSLVTDGEHRVAPGVYAAGNLAGEYSMYAVAIGSGTAVACQILSDLSGQPVLVHDTVKPH